MNGRTEQETRIQEVHRILNGQGIDHTYFLEQWDGEDVEELAVSLTDAEYQALLDALQDFEQNRVS